jgi:putative NIF3 family GTP cyclohydrolase 1 type 2
MALLLGDIAAFLDAALHVQRFPDDAHGVIIPSQRPIARIGLALEPWDDMTGWLTAEAIDALFLHRHFRLDASVLPEGVGVLAYHLAFDAALTFAENPRLAVALGMRDYAIFSPLDGLPRGMVGDIDAIASDALTGRLTDIFGVAPEMHGALPANLTRIVLANVLSPALVQDAVAAGAQCYLTGQYRPSAAQALQAAGLPVAIIGHTAGERWGLRALAGMLREHWAALTVILAPK